MPVKAEYYARVKSVCDRLALLASQYSNDEFEKRFDLLRTLCDSWADSAAEQNGFEGPVSSVPWNGATEDDALSDVDTVTYSDGDAHVGNDAACAENKQWHNDCVERNSLPAVGAELKNALQDQDVQHSVTHSCNTVAVACEYRRCAALHTVTRRQLQKCPYVCCFCCKCFKSSTQLLSHLKQHDCNNAYEGVTHLVVTEGDGMNGVYIDFPQQPVSPGGSQGSSGTSASSGYARSRCCEECGAGGFKTWRSLSLHHRMHHNGPLPHSCSHCHRTFVYASELRKHERRHSGLRPHVCSTCGKGFFHVSDLEVHGRIHQGDVPLTCSVCGKWLSSMTSLRAHMRIHRPDAPVSMCNVCNKQFSYLSSFRSHMKRHGYNGSCNKVSGASAAEPARCEEQDVLLVQHWEQKYPGRKIEPHVCSTCSKQFLQAVQLRKHMLTHADDDNGSVEFPYTCWACRRHFLFANDLRRHLVSHSDDRPFACVVCTRPFKREDDLTKHMKTHGDVRPYKCEECSERLESASKLRKHVRKVHGDRFECTLCRQFFAKRSLLSKHRREQHTGEVDSSTLAYICDRCGKSFGYQVDLRNHMYTSHSRRRSLVHVCSYCSRQFSSSSHLTSHERTHTRDRPFTCDTCGKQFTQIGSLNVHRRTHVEPQPFGCRVCGQKFASRQYAKKHEAMRHPSNAGTASDTAAT